MKQRILPVTFLAAALLFSACGGGNSVGSGVNLSGKGSGGALSLGSTTTTASASVTSTAPPTSRPAATATTAPPATAAPSTTAPSAPVYTITIEGDSSGASPFSPPNVAVYQDTPVKWVNADSKPHSVLAGDGAFNSGTIPPGGSWTWVATSVGKHSYADGTRPYAVGEIQVAPR